MQHFWLFYLSLAYVLSLMRLFFEIISQNTFLSIKFCFSLLRGDSWIFIGLHFNAISSFFRNPYCFLSLSFSDVEWIMFLNAPKSHWAKRSLIVSGKQLIGNRSFRDLLCILLTPIWILLFVTLLSLFRGVFFCDRTFLIVVTIYFLICD